MSNMTKKRRQKLLDSFLERKGKVRLTVIGKNTFKEVVRENVSKTALLVTAPTTGTRA